MTTGKIIPDKIPAFKVSCSISSPSDEAYPITDGTFCAVSDIIPVSIGPTEQPKSPKIASTPNIAAPPLGKFSEANESIPGHIRLTERPVKAQPASEIIGEGESEVIR